MEGPSGEAGPLRLRSQLPKPPAIGLDGAGVDLDGFPVTAFPPRQIRHAPAAVLHGAPVEDRCLRSLAPIDGRAALAWSDVSLRGDFELDMKARLDLGWKEVA